MRVDCSINKAAEKWKILNSSGACSEDLLSLIKGMRLLLYIYLLYIQGSRSRKTLYGRHTISNEWLVETVHRSWN